MQNFPKNIFNRQLQLFFVIASILFITKVFYGSPDTLFVRIVFDIMIGLSVYFLVLAFIRIENNRMAVPLSLVLNVGILLAIMFFLILFSEFLLSSVYENIIIAFTNPGLIENILSIIYLLFLLIIICYFLVVLRHFFFLNQAKKINVYFNTMIVFFILASISMNLFNAENLSFLITTFLIVSILLMVFNSIRISWIAFLTKKEKFYLLLLSFFITSLFIVNIVNSSGENVYSNILLGYSASLKQFNQIVMIYGSIYFIILFFTTLFHIPTAEAYDRKAQEVTSLQYFSKLITEVLDFNDLAETVTDIAQKVSSSTASWIIWKNGNGYKPVAAKNIGILESERISNEILTEINFQELNTTKTLNLEKQKINREQENSFSVISISPIKTRGETQGILVAAKTAGQIFTRDDLNAIETFSDYASVAIENSRLLEQSIEKERLEKELDVAREVQRKILPLKSPNFPNLQIASVFIPAFEVGGDYYDFFNISESKLGFVIADVSGKGISAAFIMAEIKGIFESLSKTIQKPKNILIKANEILRNALDKKSFVSAAYGYFDLSEQKLTFARAGHCPLFLLRDNESLEIKPLGLGLGLSDNDYFDQTLEEFSIDLKENDIIVLYTDGVTEAKNNLLEDFGDKHFHNVLEAGIGLSAEELSNKIIKEITLFSSGYEQYDDITLVIFKWQKKLKLDGD